jgi:hypothetical protein
LICPVADDLVNPTFVAVTKIAQHSLPEAMR